MATRHLLLVSVEERRSNLMKLHFLDYSSHRPEMLMLRNVHQFDEMLPGQLNILFFCCPQDRCLRFLIQTNLICPKYANE